MVIHSENLEHLSSRCFQTVGVVLVLVLIVAGVSQSAAAFELEIARTDLVLRVARAGMTPRIQLTHCYLLLLVLMDRLRCYVGPPSL